ncbi:MAG TPA: heme o synthase [Longimicrobiales bacterium]|nr:heme o synthase [Longimicrobiales bacterium]
MDDAPPISRTPASRLRAAYDLTKPGITAYVMITAGVSAYVASRGGVGLLTAFHAVLGTGLSTAGALALNQFVERKVDAEMTRTRHRPLPSHRLTPTEAIGVALALLAAGLGHLAYRSGLLPAAIAAISALMYLGVYTPLKRRSYVATLAGAVPGALPTLIGWTAATGALETGALALFAIAYLWQLPHVLGLGWMLRDDYAMVGFRLIPSGGAPVVGRHMIAATVLLVPISVTPTVLGYTGSWYLIGALAASSAFAGLAVRTATALDEASARRLFLGSLLYHPVLLGLMMLNTVRA